MNFKKTLSIGILSALLCSSPAFAMIQNTPQIRVRWTHEENYVLLAACNCPGANWYEIATFLNRIKAAYQQKFCRISSDSTYRKKWTNEDKDILLAIHNVFGNNWDYIAEFLSRKPESCRCQFNRIKAKYNNTIPCKKWTKEENETLLAAHKTFGNNWDKVATHIPGKTKRACQCQFIKINRTNNIQPLLESTHTSKKDSLKPLLNQGCVSIADLDMESFVPNLDMNSFVPDWGINSRVPDLDMNSSLPNPGMTSLEGLDID